jgi:ribosome maturation factor RimP
MRLSFLQFLCTTAVTTHAFVLYKPATFHRSSLTVALSAQRPPSRVVDFDGPTPTQEIEPPDVIDPADIYGLDYDEANHPIPHQPWRRGETRGCEDPIDAPWRQQAESIITLSAATVGSTVRDVTWFLTSVVIAIENDFSQVPQYQGGPEVVYESPGPVQYLNPDNPNPDDIIPDEEDAFLWERDTAVEDEIEKNRLAPRQEGEDETIDMELAMDRDLEKLPLDQETREDMAGFTDEQLGDFERAPVEKDSIKNYMVDSLKISTIAKAILDGLEQVEDDLQILSRHEVILTTPSDTDVLDSQREFDAYRGFDVIVETQDPWESNRVLRGKLLERNSMDLIINKKGRMVTIPLNFVKAVRLSPSVRREEEDAEDDDY